MTNENKKVRAMTITYVVENGLYVNITNKCTNRCDFCIRNNGDGAYGSNSLWLEREPEKDEILSSVFSHNLDEFSEVVFCGYGEPSCRLDVAREVALEIKVKYPNKKVRINTNGQSDLIYKKDTAPMYKDAFDEVSVSLNAPTSQKYQSICHSVFGDGVLENIIKFAQNVKNCVQNVKFSLVKYNISDEEIDECKKISEQTGIPLRIREFID